MDLFVMTYGADVMVQNNNFCIVTDNDSQIVNSHLVSRLLITKATTISAAAVILALQNDIPISIVKANGHPYGHFYSSTPSNLSSIRTSQYKFSIGTQGKIIANRWLAAKLINQCMLIDKLIDISGGLKVQEISKKMSELLASKHTIAIKEQQMARLYFRAISTALPSVYAFDKRSKHPAADPFNALINYTYAMLYGKLETMLLQRGLDVHIGFNHTPNYNKPSLVYDIIEPFRPWADAWAIYFITEREPQANEFEPREKGIWLGNRIKKEVIQSFNAFLEVKVLYGTENATRVKHLDNEVSRLVKELMAG